MDENIYEFWKHNSLNNIMPKRGGQEFPEGWNVVSFFNKLYTKQGYGYIVEVGCGYGRLTKAFHPDNYLGLDISPNALVKAQDLNPGYTFELLYNGDKLPKSKTKLLYTVLLHQTDEDIESIIAELCESSYRIIVAEVMDKSWRRPGDPPVFNRDKLEYITLFEHFGKELFNYYEMPYKAYENTKLDILVFE